MLRQQTGRKLSIYTIRVRPCLIPLACVELWTVSGLPKQALPSCRTRRPLPRPRQVRAASKTFVVRTLQVAALGANPGILH
jgi:hypothetical protein